MAAKATPANQWGNMVRNSAGTAKLLPKRSKPAGICRDGLHPRRHRHEAQQRDQRQREGIDGQQHGIALHRTRLEDDSTPVTAWG